MGRAGSAGDHSCGVGDYPKSVGRRALAERKSLMCTGTTRFNGITSHAGVLVTTIALLSGGAILRDPAAAADANQDDQFLALLAQQGIPALEGVPSLVDTAHKVCHALDAGVPADRIRDALVEYAESNDPAERQYAPGRLARTEGRFIVAAVGAYCPWERSKLGSLVTHHPASSAKSSWNEPTGPAAQRIHPSDFEVHATALASLIGAIPPGGITEPNPPQLPAPSPPVEHLQTPPRPTAAPPRPQPLPPRPQQPPPPQEAPPPAVAPQPGAAPGGGSGSPDGIGGGLPAEPAPAPPAPPPPSPAPPPPMAPGFVRLAP